LHQVRANANSGDVGVPQLTVGENINAVDDSFASASDILLIRVVGPRFSTDMDSSEQFGSH
jgi:hypothetical protein